VRTYSTTRADTAHMPAVTSNISPGKKDTEYEYLRGRGGGERGEREEAVERKREKDSDEWDRVVRSSDL
jgi:hypothetical protein